MTRDGKTITGVAYEGGLKLRKRLFPFPAPAAEAICPRRNCCCLANDVIEAGQKELLLTATKRVFQSSNDDRKKTQHPGEQKNVRRIGKSWTPVGPGCQELWSRGHRYSRFGYGGLRILGHFSPL